MSGLSMEMMRTNGFGAVSSGKEANTEFDSNLPAAYTTIDAMQKEHAKYHAHQVKNPGPETCGDRTGEKDEVRYDYRVSPPPESGVKVGTVSGESEERGSGGGVVREGVPNPPNSHRPRLEAKNLLYEHNELPSENVKHRGIHAASYSVHSQGGYREMNESWGSYITCRCKTRTLVITFFIAMAILLSVASLVLSTLLWFGVYGGDSSSSSSSSSSPTTVPTTMAPTMAPTMDTTMATTVPPICNCPSQAMTENLRDQLELLQMKFEAVKNRTATAALSQQLSNLQEELATLDNMTHTLSRLTERRTRVSEVEVLDGCTSQDTAECNIQDVVEGDVQYPCLTDGVLVEREGEFLVNAVCSISGDPIPNDEVVVATLETFDHVDGLRMRCRCSRLLGDPSETHVPGGNHICILRETRCPVTTDVNVTIDWEPY